MEKPIKRGLVVLENEAAESWSPIEYLVDGYIPENSVGMLFGPPDSLKSFTAIDMACHIARGISWRGRRTERAGVVYWHGEGQQGISGRLRGWRLAHLATGGAVGLSDAPLNFSKDGCGKTIEKIVREYEAASGQKCRLLIVDTLSVAAAGMKANDEGETALLIERAKQVCRALGVTILFIAHTGKDEDRGVRGSNVFEGNVDFRLQMKKDGTLTVERMKDGRKADEIILTTRVIEIGRNKHGEPVTTLVLAQPPGGERYAIDDADAEAPTFPNDNAAPRAIGDDDEMTPEDIRLVDVLRTLPHAFSAPEAAAAWNRRYPRDKRSDATVLRALRMLTGRAVYLDSSGTKKPWRLLDAAEAAAAAPLLDTERDRVDFVCKVAADYYGGLDEPFTFTELHEKVNGLRVRDGGKPLSKNHFEAAWGFAQKAGRILVVDSRGLKASWSYRWAA